MRALYIILFLTAILSAGCATSRSFSKRGQKLEQAGMFDEAAGMYFTSLQKNRGNVDAQIGMRNTGQLVLNKRLQEFTQLRTFDKKKEAIVAWQNAVGYSNKVKSLGVSLSIPDFYLSDYEELKGIYTAELYDQGIALMDEGKYKEAEAKFVEIAKLDPDHSEANDLAAVAYAEPLYKAAQSAYSIERYREAYENFDLVVKRLPSYKDAAQMLAKSIEGGLFTVAMLPFENATPNTGLDTKMAAYALEALTSLKDPFLKVVDRKNMELMLAEQKLGMSGVINEETAVSVGKLLGAKAILSGTVISYATEVGQPNRFNMDAYEQYRVQLTNEEGKPYFESRYRKVAVTEFTRENRVSVSVQYKISSLSTGEVLLSRIVDKQLSDVAHWAEYSGSLDNLYPARGANVSFNRNDRQALMSMFSASRTPRHNEELTNDVLQVVTSDIKGEFGKLLRQIVQ
jgi:tetratricopeptide (TPR) repeat protein